jgi:peptide/nickel transport system ATP-binding protein
MDLLMELCENSGVGLILITHDLGVISQMTERAIVMYAGRIVEEGDTREIINDARHPYTHGLMGALPQKTTPGQRLNQIMGAMPPLNAIPDGCAFNPRCPVAVDICRSVRPEYTTIGATRVACHKAEAGDS